MFSRVWFGKWAFNEQTGEWQRIVGRDKRGYFVDPNPQDQRRSIAFDKRESRKADLIVAIIFLIPIGWYVLAVCAHPRQAIIPFSNHDLALVTTWFLWLALAPMAIWVVGIILRVAIAEAFYQSGFQRMEGAQVIDPPPRAPPGREVLLDQMGHGRAGPAVQAEAHRAYAGNRRGEPQRQFDK